MIAAYLASLAALAPSAPASTSMAVWNDTGHELVALIAYQQLPAAKRARALEILRAHPRYKADFRAWMPSMVKDFSPAQQDKWIFAHASTWPDIARDFTGKLEDRYHRPTWHYVNAPIYLSNADRDYFKGSAPVNVGTKWSVGMPSGDLNVVQALQKCRAQLNDPNAPDSYKAVDLCWLLHLVGDIHQPLHAAALFARTRFHKGDLGGNSIAVSDELNLHQLWDRGVGTAGGLLTLNARVKDWLGDDELVALADASAQSLDFVRWRDESHELAEEFVYTDGVLSAVRQANASGAGEVRANLTSAYRKALASVARERVVVAGFRLARLIEQLDRL